MNDLNKFCKIDHIVILPQEIKPKDQDVLTTFENNISYDEKKQSKLPWISSKQTETLTKKLPMMTVNVNSILIILV